MLSILRKSTNKIMCSIQTHIFSRKYMTVSEKMEILLKQRDQIPRDYKIIYRDKNSTFVGFVYHILNFSSWASVAMLGYLWYYDIPIQKRARHFTLLKNPMEGFSIVTGVISIFIISVWLRNRYALRIYFSENGQKFRAIFIGRAPFTYEYREFPVKSVTFTTKDSAFPWRKTVFSTNGHKMYLFEDNFRTQSDFLLMLKPGEI